MEKRSRKRSRKVSEQEEASEERSPPPVVKTRRRSSGGRFIQNEEKKSSRDSPRTITRSKRLKVSFDIVENNLTIGGDNNDDCTLTLATRNIDNRASLRLVGNGAGPKDVVGVVKKQVDIKFKNKEFAFSFLSNNKKRSWKSYKQIVTAERALPWKPNDPTFSSLDAPPPLKPPKKYADLTGMTAKYRDPMSGLLYSSSEEFTNIRSLPSDIVTGYLALRGKMPIM